HEPLHARRSERAGVELSFESRLVSPHALARIRPAMAETSGSPTVSTRLPQIATRARQMPEAALTMLAHPIAIDWLREAYRRTRKDGAPGFAVVVRAARSAVQSSSAPRIRAADRQGLIRVTPACSKSLVFRVTSAIPYRSVVAASRPSTTEIGRPIF